VNCLSDLDLSALLQSAPKRHPLSAVAAHKRSPALPDVVAYNIPERDCGGYSEVHGPEEFPNFLRRAYAEGPVTPNILENCSIERSVMRPVASL